MKKSEGIKICLLVEDKYVQMSHSIYMIQIPANHEVEVDSEGFMIDPIYPTMSVDEHTPEQGLINGSAVINLGSRIYFLGGGSFPDFKIDHIPLDKRLSFRFLDTDHLELGFQAAASLKSPKDSPCVFSANNLIYALDSPCSGNFDSTFERYDPESDEWEVLPKPPVKPASLSRCEINWCDCATVVNDMYVFLGNVYGDSNYIFDISTNKWFCILSTSTLCFPFGSLYVDGSFYQLKGRGSHKFGTCETKDNLHASTQELKLVKAGPLPPSAALTNNFSLPAHVRVMATRKELDQGLSLPTDNYVGWREIFHLGGRFFCYVVTTRIGCDPGLDQFHGVHIKVFEEVLPRLKSTPKDKESPFRILASFSYRIHTSQYRPGPFFRCCAFGSVPNSWVEAPLKKKVITKERKTTEADEQSRHEHGGDGSNGQSASNPVKFVKVPEAEFIRLKAQLAEMEKRLKAYET
ncbi:hypothetical protein POM88_004861 [Heracleum sosnowskyi]|uniref:Uncharacterized protein n=1 Tax=Heracleum sosnowskyi TaxID=360622 RepID=A0AAD8NEI8_9APIA|nr:hypothetical protein POM88_004861 [Heracleum sosnowskyi]